MLKSGLLLFAMLTALLASAVYVPGAYCQDAGSVRVLVRPDPESPYAGSEWTLTLAIDHPVPYEVSVIPPSFPSALFLDRVLKNSRLITETGATRRWTIAEYRFIPESAGTYTIDPFVIIVPQGSVTTEKITVTVRDVNNQGIAQRQALVWDSPAHLSPGETAIVFLKMSGPGAAVPAGLVPAPEIFMPPLQDNFIIEENGQDAGNPAVVLKLKIIPLAVQNL
ncbi:MAG: BatD family protein, partial [Treponema sp.]|nr:BatD family protein [Treponema sp.]